MYRDSIYVIDKKLIEKESQLSLAIKEKKSMRKKSTIYWMFCMDALSVDGIHVNAIHL